MPNQNEALLQKLLKIAQESPAENLYELNAATLYPTLYQEAVDSFDGWDAALASALKRALSRPARPTAAARAPRAEKEEHVERIVNEEAGFPLFIRTQNCAFYTVPGTSIPQSDQPLIADTPQNAGLIEGVDFLEDPSGVVVLSDQGRYFGIDVRMVPKWEDDLLDRRLQDVIYLEADEKIIASLPRDALYTSSVHSALQKRRANRLIHITREAKGKASLVSEMTYTLDREGRTAFLLNPHDIPVAVMVGAQENSVFCASAEGKAIHFDAADIRTMGLSAVGVNVMKLAGEEDAVVGAFLGDGVKQVALITRRGLGKRVDFEEFRPQSRAGAGLQLLRLDAGDKVAGIAACDPAKDLAVFTNRGRLLRLPATNFPRMGRPAKGDQIIELVDEESVIALSALPCSPAP